MGIKGNEIEQLPHTAPDAVAIALFQFLCIQVGSRMGPYPGLHEQVISGEQDLPHYVTIGTKMPSIRFHPQVIETVKVSISIILDTPEPDMVEPKDNVAGRDDLVGTVMWGDVPDEFHQAGLSTAYRPGQKNALIGVDRHFSATAKIPNGVVTEFEQHIPILFIYHEVLPEKQFSFSFEIDQDLFKII